MTGKAISPQNPILIVDDEAHALKSFDLTLRSGGLNNTILCQESREVYKILQGQGIELILLDLLMPEVSGEEILSKTVEMFPQVPVIVVTGINEVDTAVRCMQKGAFDYVLKPVDKDRLLPAVSRAIELRQLRRENLDLTQCLFSESLKQPESFSKIITQSSKMRTIFKYCEAVARARHPILITGETGVGKELIAEAIHVVSERQGGLVALNAAGLDDNVFSDTLFGHAKGAFTDASTVRAGLIEKAADGTLFLDEIGDLSLASQVKLLRVLDKQEYFPLGSDVAKPVNLRFLFATHKDLSKSVRERKFREDFFYRLRTHNIHIPSLRERSEDIPALLDYFMDAAAKEFNKNRLAYSADLLQILTSYTFPGNVRELKSMVFDAVARAERSVIPTKAFTNMMQGGHHTAAFLSHQSLPNIKHWLSQLEHFPTIKETTAALIEEAMSRANNNQRIASLMLGITPQALNQRLKKRS